MICHEKHTNKKVMLFCSQANAQNSRISKQRAKCLQIRNFQLQIIIISQQMEQKNLKKRDYCLIPQKLKKQLIDLVHGQNYPIRIAGDLLRIKLSTAKLIIKKFRTEIKQKKINKKRVSKAHNQIKQQYQAQENQIKEQTIKEERQQQMKASQPQNNKIQGILPATEFFSQWNPVFWQYCAYLNSLTYSS